MKALLRCSYNRSRTHAFSASGTVGYYPSSRPRRIGLSRGAMSTPQPSEIVLHQGSRILEIAFSDGRAFRLPCEFLRVHSPSAEVRGHGPGQEVLQAGKREVGITAIEPV